MNLLLAQKRQISRIFIGLGLIASLAAFSPVCTFLCGDSVQNQRDYALARDECRSVSEEKVLKTDSKLTDKEEKVALVQAFSDCMAEFGWNIPGPAKEEKAKAVADNNLQLQILSPAAGGVPGPAPDSERAKKCAYYRANADISTIAKHEAAKCDKECQVGLMSIQPGAPLPAACPPGSIEWRMMVENNEAAKLAPAAGTAKKKTKTVSKKAAAPVKNTKPKCEFPPECANKERAEAEATAAAAQAPAAGAAAAKKVEQLNPPPTAPNALSTPSK